MRNNANIYVNCNLFQKRLYLFIIIRERKIFLKSIEIVRKILANCPNIDFYLCKSHFLARKTQSKSRFLPDFIWPEAEPCKIIVNKFMSVKLHIPLKPNPILGVPFENLWSLIWYTKIECSHQSQAWWYAIIVSNRQKENLKS